MLSTVGIEVECRCIRHVAASVIRNNGDVIADLALIGVPLEGVECIAHRHISRPANTSVRAIRVEQLRIGVVRRVARIVPNGVKASVGRDRECAEPMPFVRIDWIVIDLVRRAES